MLFLDFGKPRTLIIQDPFFNNIDIFSDKTKTSYIKVDDVHNVLEEAPGKLAKSILLFTKGLGWLTSVDLPNVERRSSRDSIGGRRMSMEEFDKPNIRRLSLTGSGK